MSFIIQMDGKSYEVPREVEACGGEAIETWLFEQVNAAPPPPEDTAPPADDDGGEEEE